MTQFVPGGARDIRSLREWRQDRKMTREQLAHAADIALSTLTSIEDGAHEPSLTTAMKLAAILQVTISDVRWPTSETTKVYSSRNNQKKEEEQKKFLERNAGLVFDPTKLVLVPPQVQIEMAALVFHLQQAVAWNDTDNSQQAESNYREALQRLGMNQDFIDASLAYCRDKV